MAQPRERLSERDPETRPRKTGSGREIADGRGNFLTRTLRPGLRRADPPPGRRLDP
jgi:hypothetical protein